MQGCTRDLSPLHIRGLEELLCILLSWAGVLPFGVGKLEESAHAPRVFQEGPIARDLPFLVGDHVLAGLSGLPYLLLQGAHGLLGLLPKLLLPVLSELYLGAQLR